MQSDFACSKRTSETILFLWVTTPTRCVRHDPWDRVNIWEPSFTHNQYDSRLSGKSPKLVKERNLHETYFLGGYQQKTWIQKHDCFSTPPSITFKKRWWKFDLDSNHLHSPSLIWNLKMMVSKFGIFGEYPNIIFDRRNNFRWTTH